MTNYLIIAIAVLTFAPIVIGLLLGLMRGSRRALLRLILVLVCLVAAFLLSGTVANKLAEMDVSAYVEADGTVTALDFLTNMLGENMQGAADLIVPLAMIIIKIVVFLVLFLVLRLLTWLILFPILKIFVRPRTVKNDEGKVIKKKKHPLLGGVFGAVQGVAVALVLCIVFNGLLASVSNLVTIADGVSDMMANIPAQTMALAEEDQTGGEGDAPDYSDGNTGADISGMMEMLEQYKTMLDDYNESALGKMYNKIGTAPFNWLAQVTVEDETYTLSGQIEALDGIIRIVKEFVQLPNINFNDFYGIETEGESGLTQLTNILTNVENIKKGLSEEAGRTVTKLLNVIGDMIGIDIDEYYNIDLAKEANAFNKLSQYKDADFNSMDEEEIKEAAKDIVSAIADSDLIMNTLAEMQIDLGTGLNAEQRAEIDNALADLVADNTLTQEQVDRLRDIFNLNVNNG